MKNEPRLPDKTNFFSVIKFPVNLKKIKGILEAEFPDAEIWIYKSGYDGAKSIHVRSKYADLEGYREHDTTKTDYLLNGEIAGDNAAIERIVLSLFKNLTAAGFSIIAEAYGSDGSTIFEYPDSEPGG